MSANCRIWLAFGGLLAGALLALSPAAAQVAPPAADAAGAVNMPGDVAPKKTVAKPKKPKVLTVDVVVTNKRSVALTALIASASGSPDSKKIAGPLAPGSKIVVHLTHDEACLFDLHGSYDNGESTDATGVALCKDKAINLVE